MTLRDLVGSLWPLLPVVAGGPEGAGPNVQTSVIRRARWRRGYLVLDLGDDGVASVPLPPGCAELTRRRLRELEGLTVVAAGDLCLA